MINVTGSISITGDQNAADRTALAAMDVGTACVILCEEGREGIFFLREGTPPSDPEQGIYVVSATPGYYWARYWDWERGRPEWFGCIPDDGGLNDTANLAAIHACIALCPITCFGPREYWIDATIKVTLQHRKLEGVGSKFNDMPGSSRIVITNGSDDILQLGPDTMPVGGRNYFHQGVDAKNIYLGRSVAPVIASDCRGVITQYTLGGKIEDLKTADCMRGFEETGVIGLHKVRCEAVRAQAGTGPGTDYFWGHYENGNASIGLAGGNASVYSLWCNAGCNYEPLQTNPLSRGIYSDGAFADLFYHQPETSHFYDGHLIEGDGWDVIIEHPIHDQFHHAGIYAKDIPAGSSVEITNPYYGPASDARACYWVDNCDGVINSTGGQFIMIGAPLAEAVIIQGSKNANLLGFPAVVEHGNNYPVFGISNSSDCYITVAASNPTVSAGALIQLSGTTSGMTIEPRSSGKASAFQYGIQVVGAGDARNEYRVSGLNSTSLVAANRKLNRNGTIVTSTGLTGGNYAVGVFT